jgi:endonuclease/exonuclease/phosphatase family metal-dependent hydrolase
VTAHLVVASYNIHRGVGLDRRLDLDRLADVIAEIGPDVIGLQEVIREHGAPEADQPAYIAKRLGMEVVMGVTRSHNGSGTYGNAVLTRLPVLSRGACDLSRGLREPRGCLRVDLGASGRTLHVFNAHFGLRLRERREQLDLLAAFIRDSASLAGPRVLMGDFNEWHRGPITRGLKREFSSPMRRMRRTHPAVFPLFRLDRIYWDVELEGETFQVHRTRLSRVASDHLPVVARLRLRPAPEGRPHPYVVGDALPPAE